MAISGVQILQVLDRQTYLGQQCLNVYFYRSPVGYAGDGTEYLPILESFRDDILPDILAIQNTAVNHYQLTIRNLSNGLDEFSLTIDADGVFADGGVGFLLPPFMANSFQLNRTNLATRNGRKRYVGVSDGMIASGVSILSSVFTDAVNSVLVQGLDDGNLELMLPVIVKRPIPSPGGTFVVSQVGSAVYKGISTQNSRKVGHGD